MYIICWATSTLYAGLLPQSSRIFNFEMLQARSCFLLSFTVPSPVAAVLHLTLTPSHLDISTPALLCGVGVGGHFLCTFPCWSVFWSFLICSDIQWRGEEAPDEASL